PVAGLFKNSTLADVQLQIAVSQKRAATITLRMTYAFHLFTFVSQPPPTTLINVSKNSSPESSLTYSVGNKDQATRLGNLSTPKN
ncbi:hypothetical protein RYB05_04935, partial [Pseudomonas syringae pv. actinidiae]|nr:hypothetical protein [Pseudomonas syringae pv. actinidiae]